jgi:pectate lyase
VAVTGVSVSPTSVSVSAGQTTTLVATISPSNATNKSVSWNSNNTAVATVSSSGVVTGVAVGSATITVTTADGAKTAICAVTVTAVVTPTVVRIEDSATSATGLCSYDGALKAYSGASNGYAINLSNASAKGINWKVEVAAAGTFTLTWRYVNGSSSAATIAKLIVNGTTVNSSVSFPKTADKSTFVTTATTAAFIKGVNEIRLETTSGSEFADIDWIEVSGGNLVVANCSSAVGSSVTLKSEEVITDITSTDNSSTNNTATGVQKIESSKMAKVYPNPFAGSATINFALNKQSNVQIAIYDLNGKLVSVINEGIYAEGEHQVIYSNSALKSGIYILSVTSGSSRQNIRLVVQ